jgi:acetoacetyl-CoA reductase
MGRSDYDACAAGIAKVEADLGPVDVLVNNAGITRDGMFHKMTQGTVERRHQHQSHSLFNMTHPVWRACATRKFGRIINISSINGQKGQMGQVNYSAAKAGDIGFTKALAQEGAARHHGQRDLPGLYRHRDGQGVPEKVLNEAIMPQIPVGRLGEPEEIARCVVFLAGRRCRLHHRLDLSANGGQFSRARSKCRLRCS